MREQAVEGKLKQAVKANGSMCPKLVSPGTDGMPDRLVLLPEGSMGFEPDFCLSPGKRHQIPPVML